MKQSEFINRLAHEKIVGAIRAAEKETSGEIRVFISKKNLGDAVAAAQAEFDRLGMARTKHRNGVLIYVAPAARKFAVIGDTAIHQKCGQKFWDALCAEMSGQFAGSKYTAGILHGVACAGKILAEHFPAEPGDQNELPDKVETD